MTAAESREYRVDIDGVRWGMAHIESGEIEQELFEKAGIGGTACAKLTLRLWDVAAPGRMAKVQPYVRRRPDGAWTALGTFRIDERKENGRRLELTAYDAMMSAEAVWEPGEEKAFPMRMEAAAKLIAAAMETELDSRCAFRPYTVDYPAAGYTMREVLGYIAAAHGGNWMVTAAGKLLLVPLYGSAPPETSFLVTEEGEAVTFGGVRIRI